MSKKLQIDIVSDTVCPWCFIGKRRLEKALRTLKDRNSHAEVQITWHPYQLNPQASQEGVNKRAFYEEKFGPRASSLISNMNETFANEGLKYNIEGLTGNTLNSHRLIAHAGKAGPEKQDALVEELFKAYFTQAKFINDRSVLLEAARTAGLDDAEKVLDNESIQANEVKAEIRNMRGHINGVPHFTFNKKYSLSGAQEPETFLSVFEKLLTE